MTPTLRSISSSLLLAAAFAGAAGSAGAATPDTVRGPTGSKDYTSLYLKIFNAAEMDKNANDKLRSMTNVGTMDPDDVIVLMRGSVQKVKEFGPHVLLTPSISEQDAAKLIAKIPEDFADTPTYLKIANGKTAFLHDCQSEILGEKFDISDALAMTVAKCMEKKAKEQAAAPVPAVAPAVVAPAPIAPAPALPELKESPATIENLARKFGPVAGIGLGVVLLSAVGIAALRRKKPEETTLAPGATAPDPATKSRKEIAL